MLLLYYALVYNPANPFDDVTKVWASVLLVQSWFGDYTFAFNGNSVAWTLSVELAFYLSFPFLTMLSTRMIIVVTVLVTGATVLWALNVTPEPSSMSEPITTGVAIIGMHPGSFFVLFAAGMLTGRLFVSREWTMDGSAATVVELACLALAAAYFMRNQQIAAAVSDYLGIASVPALWLHNALGAVFFVPLIFALAVGRGLVSRAFSVTPLVMLGEISFAIYLLHLAVQNRMVAMGIATTPDFLWLCLSIVLIGAWLMHRYVEVPSYAYLRRKIDAIAAKPIAETA